MADDLVIQPTIHVDGTRLLWIIDELARFGASARGGVSREAFSPADDAARRYLCDAARQAGLLPHIDEAGNLFVRRASGPSPRPNLIMGSHLDSVADGGRLDGAYGVAAAFETLLSFSEQDIDAHYEPVMVAFANEEGALFPYPFWGSRAFVGQSEGLETAADRSGNSIRAPLKRAGGDLDAIAKAAWPPGSIAAFLEPHIEQGPVLERRGMTLGVVDAIVGRTIFEITVDGCRNHAGTTPMDDRRDALAAAARVVLAIESVSKTRQLCSVSTVGILDVDQGQTNVVPGRCSLSAEIRDSNTDRLAVAEEAVRAAVEMLTLDTGARITVEATTRFPPTHTDPWLSAAIAASAEQLNLPYTTMPSGAGHDAQIVSSIAPIGMIFVPSTGGVSHAPEEATEDVYLVAGADVLATTAANLRPAPTIADR